MIGEKTQNNGGVGLIGKSHKKSNGYVWLSIGDRGGSLSDRISNDHHQLIG